MVRERFDSRHSGIKGFNLSGLSVIREYDSGHASSPLSVYHDKPYRVEQFRVILGPVPPFPIAATDWKTLCFLCTWICHGMDSWTLKYINRRCNEHGNLLR